MKKEALFVFISLLLLVTFVSAAVELEESEINTEEFELQQNVPLKINGKSIILRDDGVNEAYVLVDEVDGTIIFGKFEWINGVSIMLLNIHETNVHRNLTAFVNITTYGSCGDGICHERESCCTDCGCKIQEEVCLDNQCSRAEANECTTDLQCLDDRTCTIDICEGVPRKCVHRLVKTCINGDNCCAPGCNINDDRDCASNTIECMVNEDCEIGEKCSGITHLCYKVEPRLVLKTSLEPEISSELNPLSVPAGTNNSKNKWQPQSIIVLEILIITFLIFGWKYMFK